MAPPKRDRVVPGRKPAPRIAPAALGQMQTLRFARKNWILFSSGLGSILIGFIFLGLRDITVAPILLLLGYLVLIPWSFIAKREGDSTSQAGTKEQP